MITHPLSLSHWSSKALVSWEQCEMYVFSFPVLGRGLGTSSFIVERGGLAFNHHYSQRPRPGV